MEMIDRTLAPPFVKQLDFRLIDPQQTTLGNGIQCYFLSGGAQEVVRIELVFPGGRWTESKLGAAHVAAQLLNKGTRSRSSYQIAEAFDKIGAHLDTQPGLDYVTIGLYSLRKNLGSALELLVDIIENPVFDDVELSQFKDIYLQNLKVNEQKTSFLASKHFKQNLFSASHPYGRELNADSITDLTRDDLSMQHTTNRGTPAAFISGKIESGDVTLITLMLEQLSAVKSNAVKIDPVTFQSRVVHVDKEGAVQASIRMGCKSIQRTDPSYPVALLTTHILGGYFGSRLMKNIREDKGLTYGIYASMHPMKHDSYLVIGADVDTANIDLTKEEIKKEIDSLSKLHVAADELETAKNHFIGSFQSEITTAFAHADKWKSIHLNQLSKTYYQQLIHSIHQCTSSDIQEYSNKHLNATQMLEVSVG